MTSATGPVTQMGTGQARRISKVCGVKGEQRREHADVGARHGPAHTAGVGSERLRSIQRDQVRQDVPGIKGHEHIAMLVEGVGAGDPT